MTYIHCLGGYRPCDVTYPHHRLVPEPSSPSTTSSVVLRPLHTPRPSSTPLAYFVLSAAAHPPSAGSAHALSSRGLLIKPLPPLWPTPQLLAATPRCRLPTISLTASSKDPRGYSPPPLHRFWKPGQHFIDNCNTCERGKIGLNSGFAN